MKSLSYKLKKNYKVINCSKCNYTHLSPKPSQKTLQEYYENEYHQKLKQPIHEFKKELKDKNWLDQQSREHEFFLKKFGKSNGNILDVGCGNGLFLHYMKTNGWNVLGIEPSIHARNNAASLEVETQANFNGLKNLTFDVIMLRYTLEHLRNPSLMLKKIKKYLVKNGLLIIMVPNDFNPLQTCVTKMGYDKWWIRVPDHINYFNFISIKSLVEKIGFDVVHQTTDFPMELFLLTGNNYVSNSTVGKKCHMTRMNFENNMKPEILRKLYSSFAKNNIGRTCITYAKIR